MLCIQSPCVCEYYISYARHYKYVCVYLNLFLCVLVNVSVIVRVSMCVCVCIVYVIAYMCVLYVCVCCMMCLCVTVTNYAAMRGSANHCAPQIQISPSERRMAGRDRSARSNSLRHTVSSDILMALFMSHKCILARN